MPSRDFCAGMSAAPIGRTISLVTPWPRLAVSAP
jgi:hypothetical protein